MTFPTPLVRAAIALVLLAAPAAAQCPTCHTFTQNTQVWDGNGGPWLSGHVYLLNAVVTVPSGQTLTIQPGAVVKIASFRYLDVDGRIDAQGSSGSPIVFTSSRDDAAGGDTNGDGAATVPAPGDHFGIRFGGSGADSTMRWCRVRFAGESGSAAIEGTRPGFTLEDSVVEDCAGAGLRLGTPPLSVARNDFMQCQRAIQGLSPKGLHAVADNSASGNAQGDVLVVDSGFLGGEITAGVGWTTAQSFNGTGVVRITHTVGVKPTGTLAIGPGVTILWGAQGGFQVTGTLHVAGTASDPVVMTSAEDAAYGGTGALPGAWEDLLFSGSDASTLTHAVVRYGGSNGGPSVRLLNSDATLAQCMIAHSGGDGVEVSAAAPQITGCTFDANAGYPIAPVPLEVLAGFAANTATGNGAGDAVALGQTTLSGAITLGPAAAFNGTGAFVLAGVLSVANGAVLTLDPGTVLKADPAANAGLTASGTLKCNGTPSAPVVLTSLYDDSIGGDLNADGAATSPAPGDWGGPNLLNAGADASVLTHTRIRYAGKGGGASLDVKNADATLSGVVVELGAGPALNAEGSVPTITGCAFDHCAGPGPVVDLPIMSIAGLSGNTATGNANGNSIRFAPSIVDGPLTLSAAATLNQDGVFVFDGYVKVSGAGDLAIAPGAVLKFAGGHTLSVTSARLAALGTANDPIVFTSIADDSAGGDTENDGATAGAPGDWEGVDLFTPTDVQIAHATIRFTGANDRPAVELNASPVSLDQVTVEHSAATGLRVASPLAAPTVTSCTFDSCLVPVSGVSITGLQTWAGNVAQGCALGDAMRLSGLGDGASLVLDAAHALTPDAGFVASSVAWSLATGRTLTVGPGVTLKLAITTPFTVNGTLVTNGTPSAPVCFTSVLDDVYGGDANGDGSATQPAPGDWAGFSFLAQSDASTLEHTRIRYAGHGGAPAIDLLDADITLCDVVIEHSLGDGIDANGTSAPTLKDVSIDDNAGSALSGVTWAVLGKMSGTSASNNGGGDFTTIDSPVVEGDLTIHRENVIGSCIVVNVSPDTNGATGNTLSFGRGVIVKATDPHVEMRVLDILGTGLEKVVFTSFHDDEHGGDSDGVAVPPAPGDWKGVDVGFVHNGAAEHALIRYAGAPNGTIPPSGLRGRPKRLVGCRVEYSAGDGFDVTGGPGSGLVAFQNAGNGINGVSAWASTAYGNGGYGFTGTATTVYGSVAWMNGPSGNDNYAYTGDFLLGPPGVKVVWSCGTTLGVGPPTGFGGVNCGSTGWGNFHADPRFVNAPAGDLRLKPDSPCRNYVRVPCPPSILLDGSLCNPWGPNGTIYPGLPEPARDFLEMPRSVDDDRLGPAPKLGDLGAYERPVWTLAPIGEPVLGEVVQLHCVGPAGLAFYLLGFDGEDAFLDPYGYLCFDPALVVSLATLPVGTPLVLPVLDDPILDGLEVSIQAAVQGASGALETTNVWRPRFHR